MKYRNGFVSNSSSSSFLVLVPTKNKENYHLVGDVFMKATGEFFPYDEIDLSDDIDYVNEEWVNWINDRKDKLNNGYRLVLQTVELGCDEEFASFLNKVKFDYIEEKY